MYEMLARVKPIVGPKTPVTTPQIWVDGEYVGGAEELRQKYHLSEVVATNNVSKPDYWQKAKPPGNVA